MTNEIIAPKRGEVLLTKEGMPTLRLQRFFEELASQSDSATTNIEDAIYTQMLYNSAMMSKIWHKLKDIEAQL